MRRVRNVCIAALAITGVLLAVGPSAHASVYYWDNDGVTAGFGTAAGTWAAPTTGDSTQGWSTSTTGVLLPGSVTTATTDTTNFGNGATGLAAGTITVSGTVASGNMTFASGSGAIVLSGGTEINLVAAATITVNNATDTISTPLTGAATSLTKAGTGILVLSGPSTYAGTTIISAGTLALSGGNDRLLNTGTVNFSAASTLDVGSTSQTLANLTVGTNNVTGTVKGSGGALTLTGASFSLGGNAANATRTLNMSGLSTFAYNNSSGDFRVGGIYNAPSGANNSFGVLTLAGSNTITAATVNVGNGSGGNSTAAYQKGTINLGQSNTINATAINVGAGARGWGVMSFNTGLTGTPSLTIRGVTGGSSRANMIVGITGANTPTFTSSVDLSTGYAATSLDAMIGDLTIGEYNRSTGAIPASTVTGQFLMGGGTLDATNILVGAHVGASTGVAAVGTFTLNGGTVIATTLKLGDKTTTDAVTGTFNLNSSGTLKAQTITAGAGTATRNFNWNNGTIKNYDASTDLAISTGLTLKLAAAGTHAFDIDVGRTGTVNAVLADATTLGTLNKAGAGDLILTGTSTYTGPTTVDAGLLNVTGSLTNNGSGKVFVASAGTVFGSNDPTITRKLGATYTGFGSAINSDLLTTADLTGAATGAPSISMTWRTRDPGELVAYNGLISDVMKLAGTGADSYSLTMSYSQLAFTTLYPAYDPTKISLVEITGLDTWTPVPSTVNTSLHTVTATLTHAGTFAVVPEPGTLVLLGMSVLGLIAYAWRKRK